MLTHTYVCTYIVARAFVVVGQLYKKANKKIAHDFSFFHLLCYYGILKLYTYTHYI